MTVYTFNKLAMHLATLETIRAELEPGSMGYRIYTTRINDIRSRLHRATGRN